VDIDLWILLFSLFSLTHIFTHVLLRVPARWEQLPVYLACSTHHVTDDQMHHLSGAIVVPYRTGPSPPRSDTLIAHIVAASSPIRWCLRWGDLPGDGGG